MRLAYGQACGDIFLNNDWFRGQAIVGGANLGQAFLSCEKQKKQAE